MKNGHSWRPRRVPGIIDTQGMNCTNAYFCVYVNQNNNTPILWRFSACPTPLLCDNRVYSSGAAAGDTSISGLK
jgi:hypothetical protein